MNKVVVMRDWLCGMLLLFSMSLSVRAQESELARAREFFRQEIVLAYGVQLANVKVQPEYPGLPDNPYESLRTGPFFALRADWPGQDPGPTGYATADGRVVFAKGHQGVGELLKACGVFEPERRLPFPEVLNRLAWVYRAFGEPVEGPKHQSTFERDGDRVRIVWYTRAAGATGSIRFTKISLETTTGGSTSVRFETVGSVAP